jgi:2'-5' RNA ligase
MSGFSHDTFVVVDLPADVVQQVRTIRRQYGSARQFLPVEITVAGSSGVGVFAPEQDAETALTTIAGIAASTGAFRIELTPPQRFPKSGVFYFGIKDAAKLVALHERLLGSGLAFTPSPFPFSPHLTIDSFDDADAALERELLALPHPPGGVFIESMSLYGLNGWDCRLIQRFPFGRASA